jgi:hypothetical protein
MSRLMLFLFLVTNSLTVIPSQAADICEAVALRDIPALESPESILKRGEHDTAITQYRVNKKTGETSFCSHGGYCYPTHVIEGGIRVEALRLTNCKVGDPEPPTLPDEEELYYSVDVIRSKNSPAALKIDDLDNRLLDLGLCSACASNAAWLYVNEPGSRCAKLVKRALEGNPSALETLKNSNYCDAATPSSSPESQCRVADPTSTLLNVRTTPGGHVVETLANGSLVTILDQTSVRGRIWVYIGLLPERDELAEGDKRIVPTGWVYRDYLDCLKN